MRDREELQKQAQQKLSDAWKLIREAGELAKEGQFYLSFGEVGEFIPSSFDDREKAREIALEELKREGRDNGHDLVYGDPEFPHGKYVERPRTPYDQLNEEEVERALEEMVDDIIENSDASYEGREYGERDQWWHPSRC